MLRKICIALVSAEFILFAVTSLATTMTHARFASSVASAQNWNEGEPSEDDETASSLASKTPPPNIAGTWTGEVDDVDLGIGALSITFDESPKGKLSGTWEADFSGGVHRFKGSINGSSQVKLTLKDNGKGLPSCHLKAVGMLVSNTEMTGTYTVNSCGKGVKGDHGTFDIGD